MSDSFRDPFPQQKVNGLQPQVHFLVRRTFSGAIHSTLHVRCFHVSNNTCCNTLNFACCLVVGFPVFYNYPCAGLRTFFETNNIAKKLGCIVDGHCNLQGQRLSVAAVFAGPKNTGHPHRHKKNAFFLQNWSCRNASLDDQPPSSDLFSKSASFTTDEFYKATGPVLGRSSFFWSI